MTKTARFHVPPAAWLEGDLALSADEARHCAQVLRHQVGDDITIFDGAGRSAQARIASLDKKAVRLSLLSEQRSPPPVPALTLVQAVIKGDNMEWIIEKAVELGVTRIIPLIADRSVVRITGDDAAKKQDKWRRVALEACKQCGQTWLPQIEAPCSLVNALQHCANDALKLVASLEVGASTFPFTQDRHAEDGAPAYGSAAVVIGPEGDFTPEEMRALAAAGWQAWSLGALTLRSETAAICALSILGYECRSSHSH